MPNRVLVATAGLVFFAARLGFAADAADWRSWRGPLGNGSVEQGSYPVSFGVDKYLWRTQLPGKGCSTPILLNEKIYLTSPANGEDALLCYDFQGAEKWRAVFGQENAGKHRNGSGVGTFVPTPVAYKGRVILVGDKGEIESIDPVTGKTIWKGTFPKSRSNFYASPLIAGDKLFAPREDGTVFVASIANDRFELVSENNMDESVIGSPVPATNRLLIRGEKHLVCIASE